MLGISQRPIVVDKMIVPPVRDDLKVMSIGFFLEDNAPVMWRGPMLHRALEQFLSDVHWGELDTLVVDMPPGTGDVAISLGQLLPRAEAVVVTTPHRAAQEVAPARRRWPQDEHAGAGRRREHRRSEALFGTGGGSALAEEVDVPLLARSRSTRGRDYADEGEPIVLVDPASPASQAIVRSRRRSPRPSASAASASSKSFPSCRSGGERGDPPAPARSCAGGETAAARIAASAKRSWTSRGSRFVPEVPLEAAYSDQAILTKKTESGLGLSSSSQPGIMAEMLEELQLEPGQRVLEIGAGTGYNAALLRHVVGESGRVVTVDVDADTAVRARRALKGSGVTVVTGDGREGYARGAPYDRIIVTASAAEIPRAWYEQLEPEGWSKCRSACASPPASSSFRRCAASKGSCALSR